MLAWPTILTGASHDREDKGEAMALVVFLKGVNVGGHRTFRPSVLASRLAKLDVVNIGAAGTFAGGVGRPRREYQFAALPHEFALRRRLGVGRRPGNPFLWTDSQRRILRDRLGYLHCLRHDLLPAGYRLGSIQTTRGCPLNCSFCSVTAFNGGLFRHRPIEDVVQEFQMIREKYVLVVDDNLVGTRTDHIARTKDLFRAMIRANLRKRWIAQVTINMADDEELVGLAARVLTLLACNGMGIVNMPAPPTGTSAMDRSQSLKKSGFSSHSRTCTLHPT